MTIEEKRRRDRERSQIFRDLYPERARATSRRAYAKNWKNRTEEQKANRRKTRRRLLAKWRTERRNFLALLKNKPCADCKMSYPKCVMDFDHVRDTKSFTISEMVGTYMPLETIRSEAAKCDVVCANCHRLREWKRSDASRKS